LHSANYDAYSKAYTTENAYRSHIISKKHKENELKAAANPRTRVDVDAGAMEDTAIPCPPSSTLPSTVEHDHGQVVQATVAALPEDDDISDDDIDQTIDEKIAAARSRLSPAHCLFCTQDYGSLEENLTHMSTAHSFFIPDAEYLIDISGLISYLGEKIAVGNVCIYCNDKGREFRTLEAVRKHMADKSHCKIAYDSENDRLEISDFYDFTTSYPDAQLKNKANPKQAGDSPREEWEDVENDDGEVVDEVIEEVVSDEELEEVSDSDSLPDNQITYGDSHLELVLPSGARIGHRSMRRYFAQSFPVTPRSGKTEDPNSGAALVRRLLADKNAALVPRRGGFGAFGSGTEVVKARNRGEAREAGRHVQEFRDQKKREDFKTKIGFIHNSQKHFRDPCKHPLHDLYFTTIHIVLSPFLFSVLQVRYICFPSSVCFSVATNLAKQ
jgi:pre-60S factor REI1